MNPRGYHPQVALAELVETDDSGKQQTVTHHGFAGEKHSEVYRPQAFGFSSHPPKGSTGVIVSPGGERNRTVFLGGEHDDHRPTKLGEGHAVVYDKAGNKLEFKTDNGLATTVAKGGHAVTISEGDHSLAVKKGKFAVTVDEKDVTIETKAGKVKVTSKGDVFIASEGNIYLGSSDGSGCYPVGTTAGWSTKVLAKV